MHSAYGFNTCSHDDINYGEVLRKFLHENGYTVFQADSVKNALIINAKEKPEIIISDILMPETDGIELLLALKNNTNNNLKGTIMISGGGVTKAESYLNIAQSLGATQGFTKPVSLFQLVEAVKTCWRLRVKN